jgi:20S proteasome alpha/beta subunit
LEDSGKEGSSVGEGADLAISDLTAPMKRDSASGDGYSIATITDRGNVEVEPGEARRRRSRLKVADAPT